MEVFVLTEVKPSILRKALAWVMMCLAIVFFCLACTVGFNAISISIVFFALWYVLLFMGGKEYETAYFDGDIKFARIRNKSRRKHLKTYTMDDVMAIAPHNDSTVRNYENDQNVKVCDYTSGQKDGLYYEIVVKDAEKIVLYKVELDDKFLDAVSIKYRQKVVK